MKSFSRRNDRRGRVLAAATVLVIGIALFDWVSGGAARTVVRRVVANVSGRSAHVLDALVESGFFSSRKALARDNAALRSELAALREETARARALEEENATLRELALLAADAPGVTAPVLSSFRASPYGTFIVGAGLSDGVSVGSIVLTQGGFVLGQITEAGTHNATVKALFSPGVETDVVVGGVGATLAGEGGGNAYARVSRETTAREGDAVVAAEFGQRPVGVIGGIERDEANPAADIFVRLPVNLETLRFVYIEL